MKKLMTILGAFLFASVVLTSCGGEPTACDCAEISMEVLTDAFSGEFSEEEMEEKYKSKIERCEELSKDEDFEKELKDCMGNLMSE